MPMAAQLSGDQHICSATYVPTDAIEPAVTSICRYSGIGYIDSVLLHCLIGLSAVMWSYCRAVQNTLVRAHTN
jgi:hypothetical protein